MPSATKMLRLKCLDCCDGSAREVTRCSAVGCPSWDYRFGKRPQTVRSKHPRLLDKLWVLLAGCIDDFAGDYFSRQVLADPRAFYPELLASYTNEQIAAVVDAIGATPRSEWFPGLSSNIDSGAAHALIGGLADKLDDEDESEGQEDLR